MKRHLSVFLLFSLVCCASVQKQAKVLVTRVIDGDTVEVFDGQRKMKVRLLHIDAPERKQAYSKRSKKLLTALCASDSVLLSDTSERDQYGRVLAEIILADGRVANQVMVDSGLAWHYKYYSKALVYDSLENNARRLKRGLWKDKTAIAPWEFRRIKRARRSGRSGN